MQVEVRWEKGVDYLCRLVVFNGGNGVGEVVVAVVVAAVNWVQYVVVMMTGCKEGQRGRGASSFPGLRQNLGGKIHSKTDLMPSMFNDYLPTQQVLKVSIPMHVSDIQILQRTTLWLRLLGYPLKRYYRCNIDAIQMQYRCRTPLLELSRCSSSHLYVLNSTGFIN